MKKLLTLILACAVVVPLAGGCGRSKTAPRSKTAAPAEQPKQISQLCICQSCGMPMQKPADFGTEADGSPSKEYCTYCYREGAFLLDCTMEEMIEHCARFASEMKRSDGQSFTREEAVRMMKTYFPHLKRWKK